MVFNQSENFHQPKNCPKCGKNVGLFWKNKHGTLECKTCLGRPGLDGEVITKTKHKPYPVCRLCRTLILPGQKALRVLDYRDEILGYFHSNRGDCLKPLSDKPIAI